MEESRVLTVFGATVLELIIKRGIRGWTELSALMREHGHYFGPSSLSSWSYGRNAASKAFPGVFAEALQLDAEERARLADAFAYGQDEKITPEHLGSHG